MAVGVEGPGGDLSTLREHNLRRVLEALLGDRDGLTQLEIATRTELSRSTVSTLVGRLVAVLLPEHEEDGERGRPAKRWRVDPTAAYAIGVDIGQTHVRAAMTDAFGQMICEPESNRIEHVFERPHQVMGVAATLVQQLVERAGVPCERIAAVTLGLPGAVNAADGVMTDDAARPWAGIDVRQEVRKRWPHDVVPPLLADNDANLGALAEHRFGAGRGAESFMYIKWSTGIGSGLVLDDDLWRGHAGVAGDVAHLPVDVTPQESAILRLPTRAERKRCSVCAQVDCLGQIASGATVARAVQLRDLTAVVEAALDPSAPASESARTALRTAAGLIGKAVGPALTLLNLERVVVGGLIGRELYALLVEDLWRGISQCTMPAARAGLSLEMGALGGAASVWGASIAGFDQHGVEHLMRPARRVPQLSLTAAG
jgi:predicted NBD/HSP70 family sugar kinase